MRALEFITGHVIYNPAYTYKFQLKTTLVIKLARVHYQKKRKSKDSKKTMESKVEMEDRKLLEVTPSNMDFSQIVRTEENDGGLLEMPPLEYISD